MKTIGIDLGGTKILAAVVENGTVITQKRVNTPATGQQDVLDAMATLARQLHEAHPDARHVGVGSPGPLDILTGTILFAPNINGMTQVPLVSELHQRLNLPVTLENDANAAGFAEHTYGAAQDLEISVYLTFSTGIGGGIFIGDKVLHGATGGAGEVGHIPLAPGGPLGGDGHHGTWEAISAGRAIAREGRYALNDDSLSTQEVFERAKSGDAKALAIIDHAAEYTGRGMAVLQKVLDPHGYVIGGGMSLQGDFYLDRVRAACARHMFGYHMGKIRLAKLGTSAGVIGAATVAALAAQKADAA